MQTAWNYGPDKYAYFPGDRSHSTNYFPADDNSIKADKNDNEAKEFYFLGEIYAEGDPQPIQMAQSKRDAFEINYRLDRPVRDDIYEYIVEETV